jgi:hypothetical protein
MKKRTKVIVMLVKKQKIFKFHMISAETGLKNYKKIRF